MSDLKGLAAREAYISEDNVTRLKMMLAEAMGERDALRAELDRLNPEPCAVCQMRPRLSSTLVCEHCRSKT